MRSYLLIVILNLIFSLCFSQTNPVITSWLQNTIGTGSYYMSGNSTPLNNNILYNCQAIQYNTINVYVTTKGIPAYPTGPFLDGNPSQATNQNGIFKFPLNPTQNTGTPTATTGGNIGIFINGVALFDYRDGVSWRNATNSEAGGPMGGSGDGVWNRDAVIAERTGFDCSKGHPAMGNYHHHQNPSAFDTDIQNLSTICNLYDSDGLYTINTSQHSPLLGFAYDGFPIYGAYAYANADGSGGIVRMKSSYQLRNITVRTHYANGTDVTDGPAVSSSYPIGRYREDYEYISHIGQSDYLDEHNGRFCVTPEYPNGIYCYFLTVDANHNSSYPYGIGPTFYGNKVVQKVTSIPSGTTTYTTPLPIKLFDLNCFAQDDHAILEWMTDNGVNFSHFEIEKSLDGRQFENIGKVYGEKDATQNPRYQFIDPNVNVPRSYYRLKMVDFDGKYEYSKIVSLVMRASANDFKVFYSSNINAIVVQNDGLTTTDLRIDLYNIAGEQLISNTMLSGSSITFLDTQRFYQGVYFVKVNGYLTNKVFRVLIAD